MKLSIPDILLGNSPEDKRKVLKWVRILAYSCIILKVLLPSVNIQVSSDSEILVKGSAIYGDEIQVKTGARY